MRCRVLWMTLVLASSAAAQGSANAVQQVALGGPRFLRGTSPGAPALEPASVPALQRRVALTPKESTLGEALRAIREQTGIRFLLSSNVVSLSAPVRVEATGISIAAVLTELLLTADVDVAMVSNDEIAFVKRQSVAPPPVGSIGGRVTDVRTGHGVLAAAILIQGTNLGAVTNDSGSYRISNVPPGVHTLAVRRIGYALTNRTATVTDGQEVTVNVALEAAGVSLDQVVVTGTAGGEQRRSIGTAVSTIDAAEQLSKSQAPRLTDFLTARVPGLTTMTTNGRLGAEPNIIIRGRSSLQLSNSPLLYVDGVRVAAGRFNDIIPTDIESIEIIKGPAAGTLYGTEASSGVIQVITKKGSGERAQWAAQLQGGTLFFRNRDKLFPTNWMKNPTTGTIDPWNPFEQEEARGDPIFSRGQSALYNASLSGSRDVLRYHLSSAFQTDRGISPNNSLKRYSANANFNVAASEKTNVAMRLGYLKTDDHLGQGAAVEMASLMWGHALLFPTKRGFFFNPPETYQDIVDNSSAINRFTGGSTIDYQPFSWLRQRISAGIDVTASDARNLQKFAPPEVAQYLTVTAAQGSITQNLGTTTLITGDYAGSATANVTSSLNAISSYGLQFYRTRVNTSSLGGSRFPAPGVTTVSAVAQFNNPSQNSTLNTTVGAYAQEQFGWRNRLFLTAAMRVDNNSAFGEDFKWVTYPKVSASWVMSEEPFWNLDFVNSFRLRAAYGESGRQPATNSALRTLSTVTGPDGTGGLLAGTLGNPDLKPERGGEIEMGFETELFNRLTLDVNHFRKKTKDAIIQQAAPPSSGFSGNQLKNIGLVSNRGFEVQANLQAMMRRNFAWDITGNIATNRDRIEDMGGVPTVLTGAAAGNNTVGYPIGGIWSRKVIQADFNPATGLSSNIRCDDGAGTPVVCSTGGKWYYMGTPTPPLTGAIANTLTMGRLRLYGLVDFRSGFKVDHANEFERCTGAVGAPLCRGNWFLDESTPEWRMYASTTTFAEGSIYIWIKDGSFAKLRELSAAYTLPDRWSRRLGVGEMSLSVAGRELALWTGYDGYDPDIQVLDDGTMPILSRFLVTLSVRF